MSKSYKAITQDISNVFTPFRKETAATKDTFDAWRWMCRLSCSLLGAHENRSTKC
jgi:hypothetical protein